MLTPICLGYGFERCAILTYGTFKISSRSWKPTQFGFFPNKFSRIVNCVCVLFDHYQKDQPLWIWATTDAQIRGTNTGFSWGSKAPPCDGNSLFFHNRNRRKCSHRNVGVGMVWLFRVCTLIHDSHFFLCSSQPHKSSTLLWLHVRYASVYRQSRSSNKSEMGWMGHTERRRTMCVWNGEAPNWVWGVSSIFAVRMWQLLLLQQSPSVSWRWPLNFLEVSSGRDEKWSTAVIYGSLFEHLIFVSDTG